MKKLHRFKSQSLEKIKEYKVIFLLVVFGLMLLISTYLLSPLNRIRNINVNGNEHIPQEYIIESARLNNNMPLWETWFDRGYHENHLIRSFEQIEDAQVSIESWNTLKVTVHEYDLLAQIEASEGQTFNILENKELFENKYSTISSVPFLINFDKDSEEFDSLLDELNDTNESVLSLMSEIELLDLERNPQLLRVNMNDGSQVLINILNFANRINYYPLLSDAVENESGLFDLEAGTFFTPYSDLEKDEETNASEEASQNEGNEAQPQIPSEESNANESEEIDETNDATDETDES